MHPNTPEPSPMGPKSLPKQTIIWLNARRSYIVLLAICSIAITATLSLPVTNEPKAKLRPQTGRNNFSSTPTRVQTSSDLSTKIVSNADEEQIKLQASRARNNQRQGRKLKVDISHLFRENVDNYPEEEIKLLLKRTPDMVKSLFNVLNTPLDPNVNLTERVAYHYGDDYEGGYREESICRTVTRNIYPREATRQNSLVYVPNNQEFMQVIQAELCQDPDKECNYLPDSLPYGMSSVCYQKYAYKKLLYLDPLEKRMASDSFRYPSCCSCYIRHSNADLRSSVPKANEPMLSSTPNYDSVLMSKAVPIEGPPITATGCNDTTVTKQPIRSQERTNHTLVSLEDKIFIPNKR